MAYLSGFVEALYERQKSGLAPARGSDQCSGQSRRNSQVHALSPQ